MNKDKKIILKVLVGSQAHGLANKESDFDYRAVYILPTSNILSLNYRYKDSNWIEGNEDNTSYELGHFLHLATKCNPTILEVFKAPVIQSTPDGIKLRKLFPYTWNSLGILNAWIGYGLNQRKKFLDNKDNRQTKYAVAYIRTLYNLVELLSTNNWTVEIGKLKEIGEYLKRIKKGIYTIGEIINKAEEIRNLAYKVYEKQNKIETDYNKINTFLIYMRKKYWAIK